MTNAQIARTVTPGHVGATAADEGLDSGTWATSDRAFVTPVCTSVVAIDHGGRIVECEASLVSRWMETIKCEHGHVTVFTPARWSNDDE